mmetsp:Transcript_15508/g.39597  ORF Transcript_15508/g.39597 Transcript_15508/m.39597 type:complete len:249 (-) Transcript_15508:287-1033(-)
MAAGWAPPAPPNALASLPKPCAPPKPIWPNKFAGATSSFMDVSSRSSTRPMPPGRSSCFIFTSTLREYSRAILLPSLSVLVSAYIALHLLRLLLYSIDEKFVFCRSVLEYSVAVSLQLKVTCISMTLMTGMGIMQSIGTLMEVIMGMPPRPPPRCTLNTIMRGFPLGVTLSANDFFFFSSSSSSSSSVCFSLPSNAYRLMNFNITCVDLACAEMTVFSGLERMFSKGMSPSSCTSWSPMVLPGARYPR